MVELTVRKPSNRSTIKPVSAQAKLAKFVERVVKPATSATIAQLMVLKTQHVMLVSGNEKVTPTAGLVERRLRNFRQVYATLFIAYSLHEDIGAFSMGTSKKNRQDLEVLLPSKHRLIVVDAGSGSFWIGVKTAGLLTVSAVKKAPKAAFLTATLLFSSSREKGLRILETTTLKKEEEAKQSAVATRKAEVELQQLKTAQEKAHDEVLAGRVILARAEEARDLELRRIKIDQDRDQLETFLKALQVFDALKDEALKDQLRSEFITGARGLLGPKAVRILPPSSLPLPPASPPA